MSVIDTPDAASDAGLAADATIAAATAETAAPVADADPFDDPANEQFDRAYVEKLRKEAGDHRVKVKELSDKWQPWAETLEGFEEDDRQAVLELASALRTNPEAAEQWMKAYLGIDDGEGGAAPEMPKAEGAKPEEAKYLTADDVKRILAEERQAEARQAEVKAISSEAKDLGYEPEAAKGSSEWRRYAELMAVASYSTDGDLVAAHKQIEAERQRVVSEFLESKKGTGATPPPNGAGAAPSTERQISSIDDGYRAAMERFGAR